MLLTIDSSRQWLEGTGTTYKYVSDKLHQHFFRLTHEYLVFVGFWPDQNSIVVAHEGTDPTQL